MLSSPGLPPFEAILLDMDGLSLDTEGTYCLAWRQAAAEFGCRLEESICEDLFGRQAEDVERILGSLLGGVYDRQRFYRTAERHWRTHLQTHGVAPMPGLLSLLKRLQQGSVPHALATNSDRGHAEECLNHAGLSGVFEVMVTRDQVRQGKPAPDLFLEGARRLGVPITACLVLEDSATGIEAARAAGAIAVVVQRRDALRLRLAERADAAFDSLETLLKAVENGPLDGGGQSATG